VCVCDAGCCVFFEVDQEWLKLCVVWLLRELRLEETERSIYVGDRSGRLWCFVWEEMCVCVSA